MTERNNGGPALPVTAPTRWRDEKGEMHELSSGMSLRDWFAGQALMAIIAKSPLKDSYDRNNPDCMARALGAYDYADAMLKARNR